LWVVARAVWLRLELYAEKQKTRLGTREDQTRYSGVANPCSPGTETSQERFR
jgi:hypothetical protein